MNAETRLKLDVATRIREFMDARPFDNPKDAAVAGALKGLITRALALSDQQVGGQITVHNAVSQRRDLRRILRRQPFKHLARIAEAASKEVPGLEARFRLPIGSVSHQAFLTGARTIQAEALARRDVLLKYGMAETLLDDLTGTLNKYEDAVSQAHAGNRARVGASAELDAVMADLMTLVHQLDGMNLYRFRNDPEQRAAWESASNIPWPNGRAEKPAAPIPPTVVEKAKSAA
jgi:hypothetical protein